MFVTVNDAHVDNWIGFHWEFLTTKTLKKKTTKNVIKMNTFRFLLIFVARFRSDLFWFLISFDRATAYVDTFVVRVAFDVPQKPSTIRIWLSEQWDLELCCLNGTKRLKTARQQPISSIPRFEQSKLEKSNYEIRHQWPSGKKLCVRFKGALGFGLNRNIHENNLNSIWRRALDRASTDTKQSGWRTNQRNCAFEMNTVQFVKWVNLFCVSVSVYTLDVRNSYYKYYWVGAQRPESAHMPASLAQCR